MRGREVVLVQRGYPHLGSHAGNLLEYAVERRSALEAAGFGHFGLFGVLVREDVLLGIIDPQGVQQLGEAQVVGVIDKFGYEATACSACSR